MGKATVWHTPCCFASLCLLCMMLRSSSSLCFPHCKNKQTNKQTTPTGILHGFAKHEVQQEELTKADTTQTKWCLKKIYYSHRVFVLMREIAQKLTDLHARVFNHFFLFIYLFLNFQSLFSPALWYLFFLTTLMLTKIFFFVDLNIFLETLYLYFLDRGKKKKEKKEKNNTLTHTHTHTHTHMHACM